MNSLNIRRRVIPATVFILLIAVDSPALSDAHDDVVYQRYSRKVTPGKIPYEFGMKFTELTRPATKQDVEKGTAVFTFEGLGPSRVWKLPECPISCEWPSLKDFPFEGQAGPSGTNFDDFGYVCQAEELQVNGQRKRYFGFVCKHGKAVVPAEQIYLSFIEINPTPRMAWIKLPGGFDCGMLGPDAKMQNGRAVPVHPNIGDPLVVELYMRNRRGVPQKIMGDMYRDQQNGGPAFRKGVSLSLAWSPFDPKTPDRNYPRFEDFKPVRLIRTNSFSSADTGPTLTTGEIAQRAVFDIRDWFDVTLPGYYQYHFEFNPAELALPTEGKIGSGTYIGFAVGTEPPRPTVEELNRDIPALGAVQTEKQLRDLIKKNLGSNGAQSDTGQPFPENFPNLNPIPDMGDGNPDDVELVGLWIANQELLLTLTNYDRGQLRRRLEELMEEESALPMKLLLASEVVPLGSQSAALFLLECMINTDYRVAQNTDAAIRFALSHYKENPPAWLVKLAVAALSDERYVTGLQRAGWSDDTFFTMSYLADEHGELTGALGYLKCTNAVPFLIELAKKTNGRRGPVMALGFIEDQRAIPLLIDFVKQKGPSTTLKGGEVLNDDFLRLVETLGNLHAKEAVPVLLNYIQFPDVIKALEHIGDPRVIEPLQKLISTNGRIIGITNDTELEQERVAEAKIAVASLDSTHHTAKLCDLLADVSFNQYQRRSVVWRLGEHPDLQAIPFLANAIKTDQSGAVANQAITVLAVFKYKAAVDALIDSFDADFTGKRDWKRAYKPEMFRDNIAESLHTLTGQQIGANKERWLKWWKENRSAMPDLK